MASRRSWRGSGAAISASSTSTLDQEGGKAWKVEDFKIEARPIYDRVDRKVVPKVASEIAHRSRRAGRP